MQIRMTVLAATFCALAFLFVTTPSTAEEPANWQAVPEPVKAVPLHTLKGMARPTLFPASDGKTLVAVSQGVVHTWDLTTGKELSRLVEPSLKGAFNLTPTPDGKFWMAGFMYPDISDVRGKDMELRLIDPQTRKAVRV